MSVSAYHSNFKGTQGIADARGACRAHGGEGTVLGDASRAEGAVPRGPCRGGRAAEAAYGVARHGGRAGLSQGRAGLSLQSAFGWKETKQCGGHLRTQRLWMGCVGGEEGGVGWGGVGWWGTGNGPGN